MLTAYRILAYYGTLVCFGIAGLAFAAFCCARGSSPGNTRRERALQRAIHRQFHWFTRWLAFTRLVRIEYRGFERVPPRGCVMVANHPGLLDAVYLVARVPSAICVFKPSIRRNPVLGPAAVRAGYLPGDRGVELVRRGAQKVAAGATLVVFPEGTRTPASGTLGRFKPGFALVARQAAAPIQLVRITVAGALLTKEQACWKLPQLPARVVVSAGPLLDPRAAGSTAALVAEVEAWFRPAPAAGVPRHFETLASATPELTAS